jgi:hypothetical protein
MSQDLNRRKFLQKSLAASAGAALGLSLEEKILLAQQEKASEKQPAEPPKGDNKGLPPNVSIGGLPTGKIGSLTITRLICGGNLISGFAHSRDLTYVSDLLNNYFTDEKVMETFEVCEEMGINTAILRLDDHCIRIIAKYWNERGGKLQWIAQVKITEKDVTSEAKKAIESGALGVYVHGGVCDSLVEKGKVELLGKAVEFIKQNKVIAGIAGHNVEVPIACEKAVIHPDFYMKTLHSDSYWSARREPENDNTWCMTPKETIEFMKTVTKPWIAYKVMAAGAIHPRDGFKFAYENGADFICAGMFDFQVREDVLIARDILTGPLNRPRPWHG